MKGKHLVNLPEGAVDDAEELWQKAKKLYGGGVGTADLAEKEPTDDDFMAIFELVQTGELPAPAGETVDLSDSAATDEELWQSYVELQDGTAGRRRALE